MNLSDLLSGAALPSRIFLVLICVRGWVDPRVLKRLEGLVQFKIPVISSGMESATLRLVALCLNQLRFSLSFNYSHLTLSCRAHTRNIKYVVSGSSGRMDSVVRYSVKENLLAITKRLYMYAECLCTDILNGFNEPPVNASDYFVC
jgi:hypothetical protein